MRDPPRREPATQNPYIPPFQFFHIQLEPAVKKGVIEFSAGALFRDFQTV